VGIEVELKAVVRDIEALYAALDQRASAQVSIYAERYFDYSDHRLTERGCELRVRTIEVVVRVLTALDAEEVIAFGKHCVNYRFTAWSRELLATVVTVPELAGQTFLELETMADAEEMDTDWEVVHCVLRELGISDHDLTAAAYTDAVAAQRMG